MNRQWVLDSYPQGAATEETWRMIETDMPQPGPGQIVVRTKWLSLDPYQRGRINPAANYTAGVAPGGVMHGGGVGEVVTSNHPNWAVGDLAESMAVGWQEFSVLTPDVPGAGATNRVPEGIPPQACLSWMGMPGLTAFVGLTEMGRPLPGETVVVSAAGGAVGQLVGQIAKLMGARVVGIAGDDAKLAHCRNIGFDVTINYKTCGDLDAALSEACPEGVDVFWDNTGGPIHDAVLSQLAFFARVIICGRIAVVNKAPHEDIGIRASSRLIVTRASTHGLIVFDWWHKRDIAMRFLRKWYEAGHITFREDVLDGFESVPKAFVRMMAGENQGKALVRL
ncbi:NADP-dependent oxidoreductase [Pseudoprimorskyibacter insulae]|uniref:NADP-dependent oxidoreductase YfmJ n=1 Tax=Pseudoprimorskyibacter insulae TaxID=1695997 RepID=A0A2R8B0R3_9RHOB|nr:NADP-dependent oxidoreductase [Pseudoprimorskyibacter insulae]SPF81885.1 Putative NADP-dependent oxidoreductase YfmJ [Pseudoprimorskyibacter insulae]